MTFNKPTILPEGCYPEPLALVESPCVLQNLGADQQTQFSEELLEAWLPYERLFGELYLRSYQRTLISRLS